MLLHELKTKINNYKYLFEINQPATNIEEYLKQYSNIIRLICSIGEKGNYQINSISLAFLSLIRHYFELLLKQILFSKIGTFPRTHNFGELLNELKNHNINIPQEILSSITLIDFDEDGSCFRYLQNKDNNNYNLPNRIEIHKIFEEYNKISDPHFPHICNIPHFHRKLTWEFTGIITEIRNIGQLRFLYDELICKIVDNIIDRNIPISDIIYPILFLIRHSIELALKNNIIAILTMENNQEIYNKCLKKIANEHSLVVLMNIYNRYIDKINPQILPIEYSRQFISYKSKSEDLYTRLHDLDSNSRMFRYPPEVGKTLNLEKNHIIDILSIYNETDAFITFAVDVFKIHGVVPYSNKELKYYWGIEV